MIQNLSAGLYQRSRRCRHHRPSVMLVNFPACGVIEKKRSSRTCMISPLGRNSKKR